MLKRLLLVGLTATPVAFATAAYSAPINYLTNGSFESGFSGWWIGGSQQFYPPAWVVTNGVTGCCFGEAVPADNVVGGSPDAAGTHGVYFVDDIANQFLTQSVFLTAGHYQVGFDAYSPFNGFANRIDAKFSGTIAGVVVADYSVHGQNNPGTWLHYSGIASVLSDGFYDVSFHYLTAGAPAADVVIDRAYIVGVPEPATLGVFGIGLLGLGVLRRKMR